MTNEEKILINRAEAAIIHCRFRKCAQLLAANHPAWKYSLEFAMSGITHGVNPVPPPGAQTQFDLMVTALRTFKPGVLIRMECGDGIVPVPGRTLELFPLAGVVQPPITPPPIDTVPPTEYPDPCPICADKIYIAHA